MTTPLPAAAGAVLEAPQAEPAKSSGFRGKVAMISGGATGLGRAVAIEFGRLGCNVAFCFVDLPGRDVREMALLTETTLSAMGVGVYADCCDVRDRVQVERFVAKTREKFSTIHFQVNNAGIAKDGAHWRLTGPEWAEVLETNLTGAFNCISEAAPLFRGQRFGKIVNVSSHLAGHPGFGVTSYAASKAGLEGLTRAVAVELGPVECERECGRSRVHQDRAPATASPRGDRQGAQELGAGPDRGARRCCPGDHLSLFGGSASHHRPDDRRRWGPFARVVH